MAQNGVWTALLIALLAVRVPSLVQPAGGDQLLYSYVAERAIDGAVPYRDAFEQKPPGIFVVYALMWTMWPDESVVAAADLVAAALVAWLLVVAGGSLFGGRVGFGAAAIFLLLGDPSIQRLSGLNIRGQCETFIALAVLAAIVTTWKADGRWTRLLLAGMLWGFACWLKYNAVVYIVPIAIAATRDRQFSFRMVWIAVGAAIMSGAFLLYFAVGHALTDLWLGTIGYNLRYSSETYRGLGHVIGYVLTFPVLHARVDGLWYLGGIGAACLLLLAGRTRPAWIALAWIGAVVMSMAINGSRSLPQYFVQAIPALALAAAAGMAVAWRTRVGAGPRRLAWIAVTVAVFAGAWRVGIEKVPVAQPRLFGLPQAASNVAFDVRYWRGALTREAYLDRFERDENGKFSPSDVERLAEHVRDTTPPDAPVYVFGFASAGVYVKGGRPSASRFFWSRPVVLEFEQDRPTYGSRGLLAELQKNAPAVVALQKKDWGLAEPNVKNSIDFFMSNLPLRAWLESGYVPDYEDASFSVWRRRS